MAWVTCFPLPQWGLVTLNRKLMRGKRNLISFSSTSALRAFRGGGWGGRKTVVAWSLELWARGFFPSGFSTRVGWGVATLHGLPTRSCISGGISEPGTRVECARRPWTHGTSPVLAQAPAPKNTPSRAEHPAPTLDASAHSPLLLHGPRFPPGAHRVPPGTELR